MLSVHITLESKMVPSYVWLQMENVQAKCLYGATSILSGTGCFISDFVVHL